MEVVSAPVDCEPLVATDPLQPPDAMHEEAPVAAQVNVELPPLAIVAGSAVSATVGAGAATSIVVLCVTEPAEPEHVRE